MVAPLAREGASLPDATVDFRTQSLSQRASPKTRTLKEQRSEGGFARVVHTHVMLLFRFIAFDIASQFVQPVTPTVYINHEVRLSFRPSCWPSRRLHQSIDYT
jgi:hypothetical protein